MTYIHISIYISLNTWEVSSFRHLAVSPFSIFSSRALSLFHCLCLCLSVCLSLSLYMYIFISYTYNESDIYIYTYIIHTYIYVYIHIYTYIFKYLGGFELAPLGDVPLLHLLLSHPLQPRVPSSQRLPCRHRITVLRNTVLP